MTMRRNFAICQTRLLMTAIFVLCASLLGCGSAALIQYNGPSLSHETLPWLNPRLNQTNSYYNRLPSETLTQVSPHILTVTKASSQSGTTSTVRPWPSHNFFRSVLSKSGNVVTHKNRSNNARKSSQSETGILHFLNSSNPSVPDLSGELRHKKGLEKYKVHKRARHTQMQPTKFDSESQSNFDNQLKTHVHHMDPSNITGDKPRSIASTKIAKTNVNYAHSQRKFYIPLKQQKGKQSESHLAKHSEHVTFSYPTTNSILNAPLKKDSNEFSLINSPGIGFQYEIVMPPLSVSSSKPMKKYSTNTYIYYRPTTSMPYSTIDEFNESGSTTSTVTVKATQVTDPTPTTPSESQIKGRKEGKAASASTTSSNYNKGRHQIAFQIPQQPPTRTFQFNTMQLEGIHIRNESRGGEFSSLNSSSVSIHKNHLPLSDTTYTNNANETHTEIKPPNNTVSWTINHNPGTTPTASTTTSIITSTSLPIVKKDGERIRSESTLSMAQSALPAQHQPTHFYSMRPAHMQYAQVSEKNTFDIANTVGSNQSFQQQRPKYHETQVAYFNKNPATLNRNLNLDGNSTAFITRRNMFTVIKKVKPKPIIHVESRNGTSSITYNKNTKNGERKKQESTSVDKSPLYDGRNQLDSTATTTNFLTGPDRTMKLGNVKNDNLFFDQDDAQMNLHHWIETEQGHAVSPSTELPRFTNLTWPYNLTSQGSYSSSPESSKSSSSKAATSTALGVSFTTQRDQKTPDFYAQYEFYIPSAAADPLQKPILVTKRRNNKTTEATLETLRLPTPAVVTKTNNMKAQDEKNMSHLKQSDHKSKIKHSHWGSKGLNIKLKPQKVKTFSQQLKQKQQHIKVYESLKGIQKSTPTLFNTNTYPFTTPTSFLTFQHQKHFFTSPSSVSTWPFAGIGQTEMASFVTAKTPTNIWYKPTINHFSAGIPVNGTLVYEDNTKLISSMPTTTSQPVTTTRRKDYVGDDNATSVVPNKDTTFQGESSSNYPIQEDYGGTKGPVLFKVWNLGADGKLKLQEQRVIPPWALHGYVIPSSDIILNLKQIPQALRPLVTSAMNKEAEESTTNRNQPYLWHPLPLLAPTPETSLTNTSTKIANIPTGQLFGDNSLKATSVSTTMGWNGDVKDVSHSQPVSINYVLWNSPPSIYGQSIIPSTPKPLMLLSHPTPVSYFPESPIIPESTGHSMPFQVTSYPQSATSSSFETSTTTKNNEKLESLFLNYFKYFTTPQSPYTSTTALPTTTTTTNRVDLNLHDETEPSNSWDDLKKLILTISNEKDKQKTSIPLDKSKPEDLELLGNVAAIAFLMSFLRNQTALATSTQPPPTATTPFGFTENMTPPQKDQLWETVYPLFQHFLNNPNYTFIPPPHRSPHTTPLSPISSVSSSSITPTSHDPITPLTEPTAVDFIKFNHYVSFATAAIPESPSQSSIEHITITEVPIHGATTERILIPEGKFGELAELSTSSNPNDKYKTLLVIKKIEKSKDGGKKSKKKKLKKALLGAALLHKVSRPLMQVMKQPSKYWLDVKFDVDIYDILKKKLLYFLAIRYMPVFMILAFGALPLALSLVPLVYKVLWMRFWKKRKKYIKVPIPMPYPKPYPVPVYKRLPTPPHHFHNHLENFNRYGHPVPDEHLHKPLMVHDALYPSNVVNLETPQLPEIDHHYAADTIANDDDWEDKLVVSNKHEDEDTKSSSEVNGSRYPKVINSFNYDEINDQQNNMHQEANQSSPPKSHDDEENQEFHLHLHDEESKLHPQIQAAPVTYSPISYTSYTNKDLHPFPVTKSYEIGFDIGQTLAGMSNKHDIEILKILLETKKEKVKSLLEMWDLVKYGVAVASDAVKGAVSPLGSLTKQIGRRKKRRRRKRKQLFH